MRIWSLHPKYLDSKGLVALWRETLLAKHVLEGKTKGYLNHPQLQRFKKAKRPIECINQYLYAVYEESVERNYNFDKNKFNQEFTPSELPVTNEQIIYEKNHLLKKLKSRDRDKYFDLVDVIQIEANPIFRVINGKIEDWEKLILKK